ncbi:unnamed protein product [Sphagnum balticum]
MPYSGRRAVSYTDVRVPRAPLLACLTCPLCNSLLRDATTISECLHTFCRDCIHAELSNGETECCPMCSVSLGTLPLDKLRPDHQLNDLKAKLFPSSKQRKRKLGVTGVSSPGSSTSTRRKERSLNSLGVKETPALVNPGLANRKTRALAAGTVYPSSSDGELEEDDQLEPDQGKEQQQGKGMRRGASGARGGGDARDAKNFVEVDAALDALAQAANAEALPGGAGSPAADFPSRVTPGMAGGGTILESGLNMEQKDDKDGDKVSMGFMNGSSGTPNGQALHQNAAHLRQNVVGGVERPSNVRGRPITGSSANRIFPNGIWFHLQTADNQAEEDALPPLTSPYVRIKDGKLPVSHVKKYLVQKLGQKVKCEKDLEITCRDQPVVSSLPLESIRDIWFSAQSASDPSPPPGEPNSTPCDSGNLGHPSPKDFLMVLTYRRHRKPRMC